MKLKSVLALMIAATSAMTTLMAQSSSFSTAFNDFVRRDGTVGGSYVLLDRGRIVETNSYGMADKDLRQPVDKNTLFHWASVTKTLTAVAIMQLRDRGRISLDDPIIRYVPELTRVHSQDNQIARVTLQHLLSHTAGFQSPTWPYTEGRPWEPFEPTEWSQLVAMMPYQELSFTPGSKFQYSNPGFIYLARVIEAVTGDPYQVYVQKNILTPLGMTRSYFNVTPYHLTEYRSNSYEIQTDKEGHETLKAYGREFDTGITTPNGGLNAPLEDMAKWVSFLSGASPASSGEHAVLARKSLEEMWRSVAPVETETYAPPASMGLSFFLFPRGSGEHAVTLVGHTGHQAGFQLFFVINPKNARAVIAGLNTVHGYGDDPLPKQRYKEGFQRFSNLMEQAIAAIQ